MFVTAHASARLDSRLGWHRAHEVMFVLERTPGEQGVVAYIAATLDTPVRSDDGSNGDTVVVIAVDGSVETVYFRRSTQDMSAAFFGARKVITLTFRDSDKALTI